MPDIYRQTNPDLEYDPTDETRPPPGAVVLSILIVLLFIIIFGCACWWAFTWILEPVLAPVGWCIQLIQCALVGGYPHA